MCEKIVRYIGLEIIENLDFQKKFCQEKMKIPQYYFDHNFLSIAPVSITESILESYYIHDYGIMVYRRK